MKQLELAFPTVKQRINRLESIMENAEPSERFGMLEIDEEQNDPKIVAYKPSTQLDFFDKLFAEEKEAEVISLADYKASQGSTISDTTPDKEVKIEIPYPDPKNSLINNHFNFLNGISSIYDLKLEEKIELEKKFEKRNYIIIIPSL